jgi:hypothetical protein
MEGNLAALRKVDHGVKQGCAELLILGSGGRRIHGSLISFPQPAQEKGPYARQAKPEE